MANSPDSPVTVSIRDEVLVGQAQGAPRELHDGKTTVYEIIAHTDRHILDANDPLAVQVPEGVGASTVGYQPALVALEQGTAEEQFARAEAASKKK